MVELVIVLVVVAVAQVFHHQVVQVVMQAAIMDQQVHQVAEAEAVAHLKIMVLQVELAVTVVLVEYQLLGKHHGL
jgi:hypothetical protein